MFIQRYIGQTENSTGSMTYKSTNTYSEPADFLKDNDFISVADLPEPITVIYIFTLTLHKFISYIKFLQINLFPIIGEKVYYCRNGSWHSSRFGMVLSGL